MCENKYHTNSAKHDSDPDDSFAISSENEQSNDELNLEGRQNFKKPTSFKSFSLLNINFLQHKYYFLQQKY